MHTLSTEVMLTALHAHDTPRRMGRTKLFDERMHLTLAAGTKDRIDAVLRESEDRLELVREGLEKELRRREREAARKSDA